MNKVPFVLLGFVIVLAAIVWGAYQLGADEDSSTTEPAEAAATTVPTAAPTATPPPPTATAVPPEPQQQAPQQPQQPAPQQPACQPASPAEIQAAVALIQARASSGSPTDAIAARSALALIDKNGDGAPDPGVCRDTVQGVIATLSALPSLPR